MFLSTFWFTFWFLYLYYTFKMVLLWAYNMLPGRLSSYLQMCYASGNEGSKGGVVAFGRWMHGRWCYGWGPWFRSLIMRSFYNFNVQWFWLKIIISLLVPPQKFSKKCDFITFNSDGSLVICHGNNQQHAKKLISFITSTVYNIDARSSDRNHLLPSLYVPFLAATWSTASAAASSCNTWRPGSSDRRSPCASSSPSWHRAGRRPPPNGANS